MRAVTNAEKSQKFAIKFDTFIKKDNKMYLILNSIQFYLYGAKSQQQLRQSASYCKVKILQYRELKKTLFKMRTLKMFFKKKEKSKLLM